MLLRDVEDQGALMICVEVSKSLSSSVGLHHNQFLDSKVSPLSKVSSQVKIAKQNVPGGRGLH